MSLDVNENKAQVSSVNADENLISYNEVETVDYDLKIDLVQDWNQLFRNAPLPSPSGDDTDASGSQNITGASYYNYGDDLSGTNLFRPRAVLETRMEHDTPADGTADYDVCWLVCTDDNNTNGIVNNKHIQSVAKGLVGLFQHKADSSGANQLEFELSGSQLGIADQDREIRIDQPAVQAWMGVSGEYGSNVFVQAQLEQLMTACSDIGRYHQVDGTAMGTGNLATFDANMNGRRALALRAGDILQIKVIVYDKTGVDPSIANNHRTWLVGLKQSNDGAYTSGHGYAAQAAI